MRCTLQQLLLIATFCAATATQAAPPTDASIERLLAASQAESVVDATVAELENAFRHGMRMGLQGKTPTAEQERALEIVPKRLMAAMQQEFNWPTLKKMYLQIYRDSFTQEEVDGMLAFYETPAGRSMVTKMPAVMRRSMAASQALMTPLMPRLQQALLEAMKEAGIGQP